MLPILTLLIILTLSILVTRIATIALTHTGLSHEAARFQARSAFTGAGFTTAESERVVNHPVRRRIILTLMLLGNAGIVTVVASLILTFVNSSESSSLTAKFVFLVAGLVVLWTVASSRWVDRRLSRLIDRALKRYGHLDVKDYASLMHLAGDYRLVELEVEPGDWLANKRLADTKLRDEGIIVLGIQRPGGAYLGAPKGRREIEPRDHLILYGRVAALEELDRRRRDWRGDREHQQAVAEQKKIEAEEERQDQAQEAKEEAGPARSQEV